MRQIFYEKSLAPTTGDDTGDGYQVGDFWLDTTNDTIYQAIDVTLGAAVWKEISAAGGTGASWNASSGWSYSSVDSPTGIVSVSADLTAVMSKGMRVKYQQDHALSGYWTFNADNSPAIGSFTMADVGTPTYTAGKFSNALTLDGATDALSITDTATLKPTGEFTIGVWFKTSTTGAQQEIFQSYSANTAIAGIQFGVSAANVLRVVIGKNTGTTSNTDYRTFASTATVTDGSWHYGVVSYRNNYAQLYLDGVLVDAGYSFAPAYAATNYVRIGCGNNSGTNLGWFNGQIDDLYIINGYALDETTIRDQYRASAAQGTADITVTKYAIVTHVGAYSGGNTLLTLYHGTDFMLANATISNPYYSSHKSPFGFQPNPAKWTVSVSNFITYTKTSPTATTWYNAMDSGSLPSIVIPIGVWDVFYEAYMYATKAASTTVNMFITLGTGAGSESDQEFTAATGIGGASGTLIPQVSVAKRKILPLVSKTTMYLNIRTNTGADNINVSGGNMTTKLRAICGYL